MMVKKRLLPQSNAVLSFLGIFLVWTVLVISEMGRAEDLVLNEMDFEIERIDPWDVFVTPNGTVGEAGWPLIVFFDSQQNGEASKALKFKVGQVRYDPENEPEQGGGLVAQITTDTGILHLSAHVAVHYLSPKDERNLAGGRFQWILDDQVIATHDMGPINNGGVLRYHFKTQHMVQGGIQTIRLHITRPFTSHPGQHAPFQYVDDLRIRFTPQP